MFRLFMTEIPQIRVRPYFSETTGSEKLNVPPRPQTARRSAEKSPTATATQKQVLF